MQRTRTSYPSDLSDEEWAILEPLIPAPKPGGRPAKVPRREIVFGAPTPNEPQRYPVCSGKRH
ncbi:transposase [Thermus tengchongensis]|uniref:Transposase n=1 Tax=Thermus tengchongensis TaxID=1214928 RepID=A0ABY2K765_9DEIN|nr:transposase [Thermus tengchongensis]